MNDFALEGCIRLRRRRYRSGIRSRLLLGVLVLIALAVVMSAFPSAGVAQDVGIEIGVRAPDADVQDLAGRPIRLLDQLVDGKPALIEFWAAWCGECELLQPQLDSINERFGNDVSMVAVAVGVAQTLRRVNRHLERSDPGYTFVWDADGAAVRAYEAPTTSMVVLIDREGKVAYTGVGGDQELIPAVERLLRGD